MPIRRRSLAALALTAALAGLVPLTPVAAAGDEPVMLKDIERDGNSRPSSFTRVGDRVFFRASVDDTPVLWVTDGTRAGTRPVADVDGAGGVASCCTHLTPFRGKLVFLAANGLWRTDGTKAGTVRLSPKTLVPLGRVEGTLLLRGPDGDLWASDGTAAGTRLLRRDTACRAHFPRARLGGSLYFFGRCGSNRGTELWRSDGTAAGTRRVKSFPTARTASLTMLRYDGAVYLRMGMPDVGRALWRSDGTTGGTTFVRTVPGGAVGRAGGALYFVQHRASTDTLWRSDGTSAELVLVKSGIDDRLLNMAAAGRRLVFIESRCCDPGEDRLWSTDGTPEGTVRLGAGALAGVGFSLASSRGAVFFSGRDAAHGRELWRTDGTEAGTTLVADALPGPGHFTPAAFVPIGDSVYTVGTSPAHGREPWRVPVP